MELFKLEYGLYKDNIKIAKHGTDIYYLVHDHKGSYYLACINELHKSFIEEIIHSDESADKRLYGKVEKAPDNVSADLTEYAIKNFQSLDLDSMDVIEENMNKEKDFINSILSKYKIIRVYENHPTQVEKKDGFTFEAILLAVFRIILFVGIIAVFVLRTIYKKADKKLINNELRKCCGYTESSPKDYRKRMAEEGIKLCPDCGGSVKANELFCPKCKRKM